MSNPISPEQAAKNYGGSVKKAMQKAKELQKIAEEDRRARAAEEQSKNAS